MRRGGCLVTIHRSQNGFSTKRVSEKDLAERLGLDPRKIAEFRKDNLNDDCWSIHAGKVEYTEAGVALIEKNLGVSLATGRSSPPPPSSPAQGLDRGTGKNLAHPVTLEVLRCCPNPTWVECIHPHGPRVFVMVDDNRTLKKWARLEGCVDHAKIPGRYVWKRPHTAFR